jgi:hypothetical protein
MYRQQSKILHVLPLGSSSTLPKPGKQNLKLNIFEFEQNLKKKLETRKTESSFSKAIPFFFIVL